MKILVIRTCGIGNVVMATPLLRAIKRTWPNCSLSLLIERRAEGVIVNTDLVDTLYVYEDDGWQKISEVEWDKIFICEPYSIEGNGDWRDLKSKDFRWAGRVNLFKKHEVVQNMELLREFDGKEIPQLFVHSDMYSDAVARDRIESLMNLKKIVCLCSGHAGGVHKQKDWGVEKYCDLAWKLYGLGCGLVVIGGSLEAESSKCFKEIPNTEVVVGVSLPVTASIIEMTDLFIGNDCGPMHVAAAVRTKTIGIFGPTYAVKNRPWLPEKQYFVFQSKMDCVPCYFKPEYASCKTRACMKEITVEAVLNKAVEMLGL